MKPRTVFAAIGRLAQDDVVLARAVEIAAIHSADLTIVHVVDTLATGPDLPPLAVLQDQLLRIAREKIDTALAILDADVSRIEIIVEIGDSASQLIALCEVREPDLVVMRAHQRGRIFERFVGSTVDRVVASSVAPVLVLRRPVDRAYRRILVATDGTDDAHYAVSFVAGLLPDAALQIVHAVEVAPPLEEAMLRIGTGQAGLNSYRHILVRGAQDHLRDLAEPFGRRASIRVLEGEPAETLIRATRSPGADLVVVGPGRAGTIRRFFVGSVTRRLLHGAACDVLIYCREGLVP